jgi:hypothetical protein
MAYLIPSKVIWGVQPIKPIANPIEGRYRIRMRNDDFARAYFKTDQGIREFALKDNGDTWELYAELASNYTPKTK